MSENKGSEMPECLSIILACRPASDRAAGGNLLACLIGLRFNWNFVCCLCATLVYLNIVNGPPPTKG